MISEIVSVISGLTAIAAIAANVYTRNMELHAIQKENMRQAEIKMWENNFLTKRNAYESFLSSAEHTMNNKTAEAFSELNKALGVALLHAGDDVAENISRFADLIGSDKTEKELASKLLYLSREMYEELKKDNKNHANRTYDN